MSKEKPEFHLHKADAVRAIRNTRFVVASITGAAVGFELNSPSEATETLILAGFTTLFVLDYVLAKYTDDNLYRTAASDILSIATSAVIASGSETRHSLLVISGIVGSATNYHFNYVQPQIRYVKD